jgi:hypothetical protein
MGHPYDWNHIADAAHGAPHRILAIPGANSRPRSRAVVCPLSHFELLRVSRRRTDFSTGQLTCDVLKVTPTARAIAATARPRPPDRRFSANAHAKLT